MTKIIVMALYHWKRSNPHWKVSQSR